MVTQEYNKESVQIFYLKSSDPKPTDCKNGSIVVETDSGIEYRFDEENKVWHYFGVVGVTT